jgi:hypothetical protein
MTRDEMERLGALLWGYGWKSSLADALEVNRKTVSRWIADGAAPAWAADRLRGMVRIAPPPGSSADDDRDDACQDAIEPELTRIVAMAESAGWHRAEIDTALLALAVSDIRALAGDAAALEILSEAAGALRSQPAT